MGGSYGGEMTIWLAAHHGDRFRAAIPERAATAWDSFYGSSDIGPLLVQEFFLVDPATVPIEDLYSASPLAHVDAIDIPTLIIHSEDDWRCPLEQSQRVYARLKRPRRRDGDADLPRRGSRAQPLWAAEPQGRQIRSDP